MKSNIVLGLSLACLLFLLGFLLMPDHSEAQSAAFFSSTLQPIVMWSGTLADIPAGWQLCDGTNGTPDLRDRFLLGVQTGEVPGETGGAHEIQLIDDNLPTHRHYFETSSSYAHFHRATDMSFCSTTADLGGIVYGDACRGSLGNVTRTTAIAGDHNHTGNTDYEGNGMPFENRPAFYRLAFITRLDGKSLSGFAVTRGAIVMWSGHEQTIPGGWQLCDGTNGTPDLRYRFVLGVKEGQDPGEMAGTDAIQITAANLPEHRHSFLTGIAGAHSHTYDDEWLDDHGPVWIGGIFNSQVLAWAADSWENWYTTDEGLHSHHGTTDNEGFVTYLDTRPSYYSVAFIMNMGTRGSTRAPKAAPNVQHVERHLFPIQKDSIVPWAGDETTIPHGWQLCDGSNGTPDLRDRFVRGAETPGATEGSNFVQLSVGTMPEHNHTFSTDQGGKHSHFLEDHHREVVEYFVDFPSYWEYAGDDPLAGGQEPVDYDGVHSHTGYTDYEGLSTPYDNRPAYYKLAFIMKVL